MASKEVKNLLKEIVKVLKENGKFYFDEEENCEYSISKDEDGNIRLSKIYKDGYFVSSVNEFIINEKNKVIYVYVSSDELIPEVEVFKDSKVYDEVKDLV